MIQLYAYKDGVRYELDTYAEEPIKLTISAEDITDIPEVESSFSRQFRIPATQSNSQFFNYWYELGVVDFDITQKVKAEIHVDGLIFKSGELRLQGGYVNNETNNVDFEVVFFGETRDFASEVGDIFMSGLDAYEIDHILDHTLMHQTQLNWGDPNLALNGYLRYGLAIRGYEYDEDGNVITFDTDTRPIDQRTPVNGQITLDNTEQFAFTNQTNAIDVRQYTPMIQVKYLIDKIFARTAYTYSDDSVFHEDWFRNLYTDGIADATGYVPVNQPFSDIRVIEGGYNLSGNEERIEYTAPILNSGNSFNTTTYEYIAGTTSGSSYTFQANARIVDATQFQGAAFTIRIYKNGVEQDSGTGTIPANTNGSVFISAGFSDTMNAGDKVWATVEAGGAPERPYLVEGSFTQTAGPSAVLGSTLLKGDVKILDFLKSVLNRFRLVMVPSKVEPLEFVIKPWKDYIAAGDKFDWTDKLDNYKDIVVKPIFFDQSASVLFTDVEDEDKYNYIYQTENNHVYGRYIYDSGNDLLKDEREIENIFAPTPVAKVRASSGPDNMIIPVLAQESQEQDKDNINKFLPLLPKPRLLFWNGQQPTTDGFFDEKIAGNEHFFYGSFSPYEFNSYDSETWANYPDATTFDLNWKIDRRFWDEAQPVGISTYDVYWSDYIKSIYDKDARLVTAYFMLDSLDLKDLTFDDIIFINNNYYRVQKVYDAPLNMLAPTKVDLVKLLDYIPPYVEAVTEDPVEEPTDPVEEPTDPADPSDGGGDQTPVVYDPSTTLDVTLDFLEMDLQDGYYTTDVDADNMIQTWLRLRNNSDNAIASGNALPTTDGGTVATQERGYIRITNLNWSVSPGNPAGYDIWFKIIFDNTTNISVDGATTNGNPETALIDMRDVYQISNGNPQSGGAGIRFGQFSFSPTSEIMYYEPRLDPVTNTIRWSISDYY